MCTLNNFPEDTFMTWVRNNSPQHLALSVKQYLNSKSPEYLSEFITHSDINTWQSSIPVIISSQTGTGKNYFIIRDLLKNLLLKSHNKRDTMLFLVNRVALSRQNKFYLAGLLKYLVGNDKYEQALKCYTNEGVDKLYLDFGSVTVCTYHQCYHQKILSKKNFDCIVCDESHFFTSDSTFNPETDLILEDIVKNGQNSIRIYMSATPEIALETILKCEYDYLKSVVDQWANKARQWRDSPDIKFAIINNYVNQSSDSQQPIAAAEGISGKTYLISQLYDYDSAIENEYEIFRKEFKFYYMPRNYAYLNFKKKYSNVEELIPEIKTSKDKWLIFINSNSQAQKFKDLLLKEDISCEFISRDSVNSDNEARDEYDYIIANETFSPKVLIATSVIDNGINIKNGNIKNEADKVLNIAVDATNRTQFLQMIGRIRVSDDDTVNIYIKDYQIDDLKKIVEQDVKVLIKILNNDFLDIEGRRDNFDKKLFRYVDDSETFSTYNVCTVYQLVNNISSLLKIIRNNEPNFFIELTGHTDTLREKIYLNYLENNFPSRTKMLSRSIVDILESANNADIRKHYAEEDLIRGVVYDGFKSTISDTFTKYLFSTLLVDNAQKIIEQKFQAIFQSLSQQSYMDGNIYTTLLTRAEIEKKMPLSLEEKIDILKQAFPKYSNYIFPFEFEYEKLKSIIEKYQWLVDDTETTLFEAQCKWIERPDWLKQAKPNPIEELSYYDTLEEYLKAKHVTAKDLEKHKCSNPNKCEKNFLDIHGIKKDSELEKLLSKKFFDDKPLTKILKNKFECDIDSSHYKLQSILSNKENATYYLFVKSDD